MKEFARKGYKNASTNEIVKEANISKGILFHYFKNKKDLFLFLYDHSVQVLQSELIDKIDLTEKDILVRMPQIAQLKYTVYRKYPDMYSFCLAATFEDSNEVKNDLEERSKGYFANALSRTFEDIDTSKFKDGIDVKKAINVIYWSLEGFAMRLFNEVKKNKFIDLSDVDFQKSVDEMNEYLELFRRSFYR